jgi:hypothetical protein
MIRKRFCKKAYVRLIVALPIAALGISQLATAATYDLRDRQGVPIYTQLDLSPGSTLTMYDNNGNEVVYAEGPAYSPKATCGACHDYTAITKAYHFMQGALPGPEGSGMGVSDTWSSENQDGIPQKYLSNAYGHLLSGGQFGAW